MPYLKLLCGFLFLLSLTACGGSDDDSARPEATGAGVIRGRVILSGVIPVPRVIPGSPEAMDESIVPGPENGLKNVIVYLKNAPRSALANTTPVVLDQVNCVYVPHVLALQVGQTLRLKSSDKVMHDVHLKCAVNPDMNFGFPGPGQHDITFAHAEPPFQVKCDVHSWMSAWIAVFDHPWFAVSGDDGSFVIEHVPPGQYTLAAWQEVLPEQEQPITVGDSAPVKVTFTFQNP